MLDPAGNIVAPTLGPTACGAWTAARSRRARRAAAGSLVRSRSGPAGRGAMWSLVGRPGLSLFEQHARLTDHGPGPGSHTPPEPKPSGASRATSMVLMSPHGGIGDGSWSPGPTAYSPSDSSQSKIHRAPEYTFRAKQIQDSAFAPTEQELQGWPDAATHAAAIVSPPPEGLARDFGPCPDPALRHRTEPHPYPGPGPAPPFAALQDSTPPQWGWSQRTGQRSSVTDGGPPLELPGPGTHDPEMPGTIGGTEGEESSCRVHAFLRVPEGHPAETPTTKSLVLPNPRPDPCSYNVRGSVQRRQKFTFGSDGGRSAWPSWLGPRPDGHPDPATYSPQEPRARRRRPLKEPGTFGQFGALPAPVAGFPPGPCDYTNRPEPTAGTRIGRGSRIRPWWLNHWQAEGVTPGPGAHESRLERPRSLPLPQARSADPPPRSPPPGTYDPALGECPRGGKQGRAPRAVADASQSLSGSARPWFIETWHVTPAPGTHDPRDAAHLRGGVILPRRKSALAPPNWTGKDPHTGQQEEPPARPGAHPRSR